MKAPLLRRFALLIALGIVIAILINELSFSFLKSPAGRAPDKIELVIPAGTADRIARGEPDPAIPTDMTFVAGDTLVVKNEDAVDHHLGPLFIPAGSSASLLLSDANKYSYSCSFEKTQVFGLDVQEPVTSATRLYGILLAGLPLGIMLAIYSLVAYPIKPAGGAA